MGKWARLWGAGEVSLSPAPLSLSLALTRLEDGVHGNESYTM